MSQATQMIRSAAVVQVRDVVASEAFYREKLGFTSAGFWGEPPCFCIVQRDTVTIFLDQSRSTDPIPVNQYWAAYVYVSDVDGLALELRDNGLEIIRGVEDTHYGCREFDIRDPDGHLICFGQDIDSRPADPGL